MSSKGNSDACLTATCKDGRRLAYTEVGAPDGRPLVFFPGMPGSRLYGQQLEPAASDLGFRVVTYDLPGVGRSDFKPGRTLAGTADDVAELADQIGADRFDVVGAGGGAPHALACAWRLGDRVRGVAILDGDLPPSASSGDGEQAPAARLLRRAVTTPWANRLVMGLVAQGARRFPGFILKQMEANAPESDLAILSRPDVPDLVRRAASDAFSQGGRGQALEMALLSGPWGIPLGEIAVEVHLWHGEHRPASSPAGRTWMAGALPRTTTNVVPGAGALWLFDRADVVLSAFLTDT